MLIKTLNHCNLFTTISMTSIRNGHHSITGSVVVAVRSVSHRRFDRTPGAQLSGAAVSIVSNTAY